MTRHIRASDPKALHSIFQWLAVRLLQGLGLVIRGLVAIGTGIGVLGSVALTLAIDCGGLQLHLDGKVEEH